MTSVTIISPHLDDAVFSCGMVIADSPGTHVITIFAGAPPPDTPAPAWDRDAGFASARQAVEARREEDRRALAVLGAEAIWLDYWDGQYGRHYRPADIASGIRRVLRIQSDGLVLAPLGLFHPDHVLVHEACRLLMEEMREMRETQEIRDSAVTGLAGEPALLQPPHYGMDDPRDHGAGRLHWLFYEDAIHRCVPGIVQERLGECRAAGLVATPVKPPLSTFLPSRRLIARKAEAVNTYLSQLPLFNDAQLGDLCAPERFWLLAPLGETRPSASPL